MRTSRTNTSHKSKRIFICFVDCLLFHNTVKFSNLFHQKVMQLQNIYECTLTRCCAYRTNLHRDGEVITVTLYCTSIIFPSNAPHVYHSLHFGLENTDFNTILQYFLLFRFETLPEISSLPAIPESLAIVRSDWFVACFILLKLFEPHNL